MYLIWPLALQTSFPAAQLLHFVHLLRWADLVQGIVGETTVASCFAGGAVKVCVHSCIIAACW
jgi:hypothetical protein